MKKFIKTISLLFVVIVASTIFVSCGGRGKNKSAEKIELAKVLINDVEFENSKETKIKEEDGKYVISGMVNAMSDSQKIAFGEEGVTHVVALKFIFDRERTISYFEIKGNNTKAFSDEKNVENYAGTISSLLDSEDGEDAYCNLVLSAKTEEYKFKIKYSDGTERVLELDILATLATASAED